MNIIYTIYIENKILRHGNKKILQNQDLFLKYFTCSSKFLFIFFT